MKLFSDTLKQKLITIKDNTKTINIITPSEPPYVLVTENKHIYQVKLGKLLATVISNPQEVKALVEEYKEMNGNLEHYKISYSTDYVEVYRHELYAIDSTRRSCMTDEESVRIYDYDERLSLLLIHKETKLVARTLVRSDKMEYVRLYIDHNYIKPHIARAVVAKQGYSEGDLEGIKLRFIEDNDTIICPYLDKVSNFEVVDDEYLLITRHGEFDGSTTSGRTRRYYTCDDCGDRIPADNSVYMDDRIVCNCCVDNNYIYYQNNYYNKNDCIINLSNNELIPLCCIDNEDIAYTEAGEWYNNDEVACINDYYYHISECKVLVTEDNYGNSYALTEDCIYNPEELDMLPKGYWLKKQIEEVLAELQDTLVSLQVDLFKDNVIIELSSDEIDALIIEIIKIEKLL